MSVNASLLFHDANFLVASLSAFSNKAQSLIISDDDDFLANYPNQKRLDFTAAGLNQSPISFDDVRQRILEIGSDLPSDVQLVVDMRWGLRSVSASANFERWGGQCDQIMAALCIPVISVYEYSVLIEDQLIAALRGHSHFLSPSGVFSNPYWLPPDYLNGATLTQQVTYLLSRLVPDYAQLTANEGLIDDAASGADPHWINTARRIRPGGGSESIWKIRCFGRLRIYLSDGSQIRWAIPGSAPKKSKALFAFLLQRGERGARAEQLAELLWGDEPDDSIKRARLHHAIAMLRRTLGGKEFVVRTGEYYSLTPPIGTWIDIASFEQLCHRSKVLVKNNQSDEAIMLLDAADRLYTGDLFEDLLPEFVETDIEDWVLPRRIWLKEMALKVQRDKAVVLRLKGRLREALECCQKALAMDPTCEMAHAEALRIFHAQNRPDTISRQYRQYRAALDSIGAKPGSDSIDKLYAELLNTAP